MLKVSFGQLKPACDTRIIHLYYALEHLFSMDKTEGKKNNVQLEMRNLKQTELQRLKERKAEDKKRKR